MLDIIFFTCLVLITACFFVIAKSIYGIANFIKSGDFQDSVINKMISLRQDMGFVAGVTPIMRGDEEELKKIHEYQIGLVNKYNKENKPNG
jgi:hypothetical protein